MCLPEMPFETKKKEEKTGCLKELNSCMFQTRLCHNMTMKAEMKI